MAAHDLSNSPPHAVAHHRAAQRLLDAEAEAAHRQFVGAKENCKMGTGSALSGAVHGVKFTASHQPNFARKFQAPGTIRA